jgi:hypothetical protein
VPGSAFNGQFPVFVAQGLAMLRTHNAALAHQKNRFMRPDAHRYLRPDWPRWQIQSQETALQRKYSPEQPRVPAGSSDGGQWSSGAVTSGVEVNDDPVLDLAEEIIAAGASASYQECLDRCVPLLERFASPGSDRNQWDFTRCMNICLGRNK